eukprot:7034917-Prymnesium_polylepis.1
MYDQSAAKQHRNMPQVRASQTHPRSAYTWSGPSPARPRARASRRCGGPRRAALPSRSRRSGSSSGSSGRR